jgi:SecD/SecF fusion protein
LVGGDSLADFALALLLGVAIGTYSSVFSAAPLAVVFDARSPHTSAQAARKTAATNARTIAAVR